MRGKAAVLTGVLVIVPGAYADTAVKCSVKTTARVYTECSSSSGALC